MPINFGNTLLNWDHILVHALYILQYTKCVAKILAKKTKLKAIENSYYIWNETTYRNKIVSKTKV